jgi:glutamate-1-semialdehyde 2,1-aminomutase
MTLNRSRLKTAFAFETARFEDAHPRSRALFAQAQRNLLGGVPMNWMTRWPGAFPLFVTDAKGAHFRDVDGHDYIDFCLGDTGAMTGHAPDATVAALAERAARGSTLMLPTEDALWVGAELERRFNLPFWQFALTATDANRFAIRLARQITGRKLVLVFNYCYHGSVDEAFLVLDQRGAPALRPGNIGPGVHPALTTRVIEFNDIGALAAALAPGDVSCVLAEPALTNIGIVQPEPGFHDALREITRRAGTLLIIDETHTICCGEGGYTQTHGLTPDMLTIGKPIAGGVPAAVYGMSAAVQARVLAASRRDEADTGGIGGTLAGNALSIAATRATLEHVLTAASFARAIPLAERWTAGVQNAIDAYGLPWHVARLGCRAEYWFIERPPRNGGEAAASIDVELDAYMHLAMLNRGILMTPFHNMALMCAATTEADVDQHSAAFRECVAAIVDA